MRIPEISLCAIIIICFVNCTKNTSQKITTSTGCSVIKDSQYDVPSGIIQLNATFHYNEQNQIVSVDNFYTYNIEYNTAGRIEKIDKFQGVYQVGTYLVNYYTNAPDFIAGYIQLDGNQNPTDTVSFQYDGERLAIESHTQDNFIITFHFQNPGGNGLDAVYLHYGNVPNNHLNIHYRPYGTDIKNPFYTTSKENQFLLYFFSGEYAYQSNWPTEFEFHDLNDASKIIKVIQYQYQFDSNNNVIRRISLQAVTPPNFSDFKAYREDDYAYLCK